MSNTKISTYSFGDKPGSTITGGFGAQKPTSSDINFFEQSIIKHDDYPNNYEVKEDNSQEEVEEKPTTQPPKEQVTDKTEGKDEAFIEKDDAIGKDKDKIPGKGEPIEKEDGVDKKEPIKDDKVVAVKNHEKDDDSSSIKDDVLDKQITPMMLLSMVSGKDDDLKVAHVQQINSPTIDLTELVQRIMVAAPSSSNNGEVRITLAQGFAGTDVILRRDKEGMLLVNFLASGTAAYNQIANAQDLLKRRLEVVEGKSVNIEISDKQQETEKVTAVEGSGTSTTNQ
ncbi:hypothetical protein [Lawsonia intracellularis]|uniref:hypothetical protein n=1 Tax=Lawsonia intracellularis TaxID=29546 RepID=UPI0021E58CD0|nr:hypothetical protein [Lawsonia intracellularis]UYH52903.1 hypothetical protein OCT60_06405 [Lawsonia intracellularis]